MKRYGLLLATLAMLLLTGGAIHKSKWLSPSRRVSTPARPRHTRSSAPLETSAGWHYRQNQPNHWRYCLLQN